MNTTIGSDIPQAVSLLQEGKLVAIPTETVYGLAANALDPEAVVRIFEAKNRPQFNPLIVHIGSWTEAIKYANPIPEKAIQLAAVFCPGALTFLLPKRNNIPDIVTAGSPMVALRVPAHPVAQALLSQIRFPLAAPSANPFGYISPTTAQHVLDGLAGKIPYILDGGSTELGIESTIIGFDEQERVIVYRLGAVTIESMEKIVDEKLLMAPKVAANKPVSAGQLASHYAPHRPLLLGDIVALAGQFEDKKIASISFCKRNDLPATVQQFILSEGGDMNEAARKLFDVLHRLDALDIEAIIAEPFPNEGLGRAINDRLVRAQANMK